MARPDRQLSDGRLAVYRHPVAVRAMHWLNVIFLLVMLTSGLQIFNAHPALYFGKASDFDRPALSMEAVETPSGLRGVTKVFGASFDTTGLFGASKEGEGLSDRGFPVWITLPPGRDLATARVWHFFFAWALVLNGAAYLALGLAGGRIRRELLPDASELRGLGGSIREHLRLHFPKGEAARRYNVLQKLSYLAVIFLLLPLMVLTGMTMSPGLDAAAPWLPGLFGGRQTARTIHFLSAAAIVLFVVVHVAMVFAAGVVNEMRSMITGRYVIDPGEAPAPEREVQP